MNSIVNLTLDQWVFIATVPLLTLFFLHAAISTLRTHQEINFDSGILMWCAVINFMAILLEFHCFHGLAVFNQIMQTSMMVYILFRVSDLIARGKDEANKNCDKLSAISCGIALLFMIGVFVYSLFEENQFQFMLLKLFEFGLGILIFYKCNQLQDWLSNKQSLSLGSKSLVNPQILKSDFLQMRQRQLSVIKVSYFVQNVLFVIEFILYFARDSQFGCVVAQDHFSAIFRGICELIPTELFLISFWLIPRRFYSYSQVDIWPSQEDKINEPLLEGQQMLGQSDSQTSLQLNFFKPATSRRNSKRRDRTGSYEDPSISLNKSRLTDAPVNQQY